MCKNTRAQKDGQKCTSKKPNMQQKCNNHTDRKMVKFNTPAVVPITEATVAIIKLKVSNN